MTGCTCIACLGAPWSQVTCYAVTGSERVRATAENERMLADMPRNFEQNGTAGPPAEYAVTREPSGHYTATHRGDFIGTADTARGAEKAANLHAWARNEPLPFVRDYAATGE